MASFIYSLILYPIFYIWPAYVANGAPVIFGRGKNRLAIDMGRKLGGKPIFGKHKTVRGLIGGIASGVLMAALESLVFPYMLVVGIALTLGTHAGDLLGSFIKRRTGKKEGTQTYLLDQYLFLVFALLFALPFGNMPTWYGIIFLVVLTGILHPLTNFLAHRLRIKEVPW